MCICGAICFTMKLWHMSKHIYTTAKISTNKGSRPPAFTFVPCHKAGWFPLRTFPCHQGKGTASHEVMAVFLSELQFQHEIEMPTADEYFKRRPPFDKFSLCDASSGFKSTRMVSVCTQKNTLGKSTLCRDAYALLCNVLTVLHIHTLLFKFHSVHHVYTGLHFPLIHETRRFQAYLPPTEWI